jgi:hypothetical protein
MVIVLFVGFGFAALRSGSALWASAVFTLTVAALSAAVLGVMARRGRARMTWAGFALFAWVYFGTTFGPWADRNGVTAPPYLTKWLLDFPQTRTSLGPWRDTAPSGEELFLPPPRGLGGGLPPGAWYGAPPVGSSKNARSPVPPRGFTYTAALPDRHQFRRIGHCLAAILFDLMGAGLGRLFAMREEPPNP